MLAGGDRDTSGWQQPSQDILEPAAPHIELLLDAVEDALEGEFPSASVTCLLEFLSALSGAHRSHHTHSACHRARATDADPGPLIAHATLSLALEKVFLFLPPTERKQVFEGFHNLLCLYYIFYFKKSFIAISSPRRLLINTFFVIFA